MVHTRHVAEAGFADLKINFTKSVKAVTVEACGREKCSECRLTRLLFHVDFHVS
jgi:hypothetical protein